MRLTTPIIAGFTSGAALVAASGYIGWDALSSAVDPRLNSARSLSALVCGVAASGLLAMAFIISDSVSKRSRRLQKYLDDLTSGLDARLSPTDGWGALSDSFNRLSDAVVLARREKITREELAVEKEYSDNIIRSISDLLIVLDRSLNITKVNRAACEALQYDEQELIGRQLTDVLKPEPYLLRPRITELLSLGPVTDYEATYQTKSGRLIHSLMSASAMIDKDGRTHSIITVGKDVTQRQRAQLELLEAKSAAESANRAKSRFLANMSHEIRTPMTAILGFADVLLRPQSGDADRVRCARTIRRNGEHLLHVLNDILDISKIEAGKMTVEKISTSPIQIVQDAAGLMGMRAEEKKIGFTVDFTSEIPETIECDPVRLRQILMNLLSNAIKFTREGGVRLNVHFAVAEQDGAEQGTIHFEVEDSGVGMTPRQLKELFKPFNQADASTTRQYGGTGLGLAISRRLADMLGGVIDVSSVPGKGSIFKVSIPTGPLQGVNRIDAVTAKATASASDAGDTPLTRFNLRGTVLLAEDGADNQSLISLFLRDAGLNVEIAENGLAAVERTQQAVVAGQPFDIILMDMQMPEMDGFEATARLRLEGYKGIIVALTANAMDGDREQCLMAGCDDFATKPIEHDKFMRLLAKYVPATDESTAAPSNDNLPAPHNEPTRLSQANSQLVLNLPSRPALASLVRRFVGGLPARIAAITAAHEIGDLDTLAKLAHQLKGAAGGYGLAPVSLLAGQLEEMSRSTPTPSDLHQRMEQLTAMCASVRIGEPGDDRSEAAA